MPKLLNTETKSPADSLVSTGQEMEFRLVSKGNVYSAIDSMEDGEQKYVIWLFHIFIWDGSCCKRQLNTDQIKEFSCIAKVLSTGKG